MNSETLLGVGVGVLKSRCIRTLLLHPTRGLFESQYAGILSGRGNQCMMVPQFRMGSNLCYLAIVLVLGRLASIPIGALSGSLGKSSNAGLFPWSQYRAPFIPSARRLSGALEGFSPAATMLEPGGCRLTAITARLMPPGTRDLRR